MKESTLDFDHEKREIFEFSVNLIQHRSFLRDSFGVFYECIKCLGPRIAENHIKMLN
jgi:hypothetical protein